jgi:polysaccharide export outer membrane protein
MKTMMNQQPSLILAAAALALLPTACATPRSGSSYKEIQQASAAGQIKLVPVTGATLPPPPAVEKAFPAELMSGSEFDYDRLGAGDRLNIRIWESGTPTVFTGAGGTDLGEVTIDESGKIYLPYAGAVHAAGMTIPELRAAVFARLRTVVLNPQVDIRAGENRSKLVSVQGAAGKTGSFAIQRGRTKLAALLAEVAPDQKNPEMLEVTLRRGDVSGTVRLSDIYSNAALDVPLRPGDSVILKQVDEHVTVLGATGSQGTVQVPKRDYNVIDAIGDAHGLSGDAADPRAVFLIRSQVDPASPPLVYQFDMRNPETIALARRFVVRNNDSILVSSLPFAQTMKVVAAIAQGLTGLRSASMVAVP